MNTGDDSMVPTDDLNSASIHGNIDTRYEHLAFIEWTCCTINF